MTLSDAVVLKVTHYKERDKIVKLFTPHFGLLSGYVRGTKKEPLDWLQPLCLIETHVVEKEGLCRLTELSLKNPYPLLRKSLPALQTAGALCRHLLKTQHEMNPQEGLFQLLVKMLYALEKGTPPPTIQSAFVLKLLHQEGILCLDTPSERFCQKEWELVTFLVQNRSIERLKELYVDNNFVKNVEQLLF